MLTDERIKNMLGLLLGNRKRSLSYALSSDCRGGENEILVVKPEYRTNRILQHNLFQDPNLYAIHHLYFD